MQHALCEGEEFVIPAKYSIVRIIPNASLGVAAECNDNEKREKVIVQKCNVFSLEELNTLVEHSRLQRILQHKNIIAIEEVFPFDLAQTHIFVKRGFYPGQLAKLLSDSPDKISPDHTQSFVYQIFCALYYLHSANLVCRELTPASVVTNRECHIQVVDVGFSIWNPLNDAMHMGPTTKFNKDSIFYTAPEVLACSPNVGAAANIWSLGCIFAQLLTKLPLIRGNNASHQLCLIASLLRPTEEDLSSIIHRESMKKKLRESTQQDTMRSVKTSLISASDDAIDLAVKMLQFNPALRISAADALRHPYFEDIFDAEELQTAPRPCSLMLLEHVPYVSLEDGKVHFLEEVRNFEQIRSAQREVWARPT